VWTCFQQGCRGDEVFAGLGLIELREYLARLVFVAGIAAEREKGVGSEGEEAVEGEMPSDVFDVRIQAAILMNHEDARKPVLRSLLKDEIAARFPIPLGRVELEILRLEPLVLGADYLRRKVGTELVEQHHRRDAANRELGGLVEEPAAVDAAVDVSIEQVEQLLIEIMCGLTGHGATLRLDCPEHTRPFLRSQRHATNRRNTAMPTAVLTAWSFPHRDKRTAASREPPSSCGFSRRRLMGTMMINVKGTMTASKRPPTSQPTPAP
jgi:hypothetical protein